MKFCIVLPLHIYLFPLEPYVPYTIEVSAATHAGEGDVNTIIDFTEEGSKYTSNTKAFQPKRPTAKELYSSLSPQLPSVGIKTACRQIVCVKGLVLFPVYNTGFNAAFIACMQDEICTFCTANTCMSNVT